MRWFVCGRVSRGGNLCATLSVAHFGSFRFHGNCGVKDDYRTNPLEFLGGGGALRRRGPTGGARRTPHEVSRRAAVRSRPSFLEPSRYSMRKYRLLPLLFGVSAQQSSTGAEFCSNDNEGCLDSKCCTSEPNFGCYRRRGRAYAACRRTPNGLCDQRSTDWLCPGTWEAMFLACSPRFGACDDTKCCQDSGTYGCYKKTTSTYAQCRPLPAEGIACVDTAEWTCPGKWEDDDVGHQAETTLELLARLGSWETECTDNYGNCAPTATSHPGLHIDWLRLLLIIPPARRLLSYPYSRSLSPLVCSCIIIPPHMRPQA